MTDTLPAPATATAAPHPRLSLNQATIKYADLATALAVTADAGVQSIGLWREPVAEVGLDTAVRLVADSGLRVSSLCRGGFFTGTRPEREATEDNRRAVDEAATLGSPILVLVCGPAIAGDIATAEADIRRGIERLLPAAHDAGVTCAIEPFHPMFLAERSAIVTLEQANRILDEFADPALAIALDTYHVWWDPALPAGLQRATGRIAAVHIADWLVPTPSLLTGRGLPGDGVIPLAKMLTDITATGFTGPMEVEVLNPQVWQRPIAEVAHEVRTRMAHLA